MDSFFAFWQSLPTIGKVYLVIALPTTVLFLVIFVMSLVGHDADAADGDFDVADGIGGFVVSFKAILSFFMVFSWTGLSSIINKWSVLGSLTVSILSGLVAMLIVGGLMYLMSKLTYNGKAKYSDAIGKEATVYLTIPAMRQGFGKIEVLLSGALRVVDAMTEETEPIKTGSPVEIVDSVNEEYFIVKSKR